MGNATPHLDTKTALAMQFAVSDLAYFQASAARLEDRVRNAATLLVKVAAGAIATSIAGSELSGNSASFIQSNSIAIGVISLLLAIFGSVLCMSSARDRKHYVRTLQTLNKNRQAYAETLNMLEYIPKEWRNDTLKVWPIDSISTLSLILIVLISTTLFTTSLILWSANLLWCVMASAGFLSMLCILATKVSEP